MQRRPWFRPAFPRPSALLALTLVLGASVSCSKVAPEIQAGDLIQIDELARAVADSTATGPALLHVGFTPLFRSGHIPGSLYVGPGSKPEGIAALEQTLKELPPDRAVVLYCGCCPWTDCPNVRPAFRAAKRAGRQNVRVLYIARNFERDWIAKGLPWLRGSE
jgi:hypothetical protein